MGNTPSPVEQVQVRIVLRGCLKCLDLESRLAPYPAAFHDKDTEESNASQSQLPFRNTYSNRLLPWQYQVRQGVGLRTSAVSSFGGLASSKCSAFLEAAKKMQQQATRAPAHNARVRCYSVALCLEAWSTLTRSSSGTHPHSEDRVSGAVTSIALKPKASSISAQGLSQKSPLVGVQALDLWAVEDSRIQI